MNARGRAVDEGLTPAERESLRRILDNARMMREIREGRANEALREGTISSSAHDRITAKAIADESLSRQLHRRWIEEPDDLDASIARHPAKGPRAPGNQD